MTSNGIGKYKERVFWGERTDLRVKKAVWEGGKKVSGFGYISVFAHEHSDCWGE